MLVWNSYKSSLGPGLQFPHHNSSLAPCAQACLSNIIKLFEKSWQRKLEEISVEVPTECHWVPLVGAAFCRFHVWSSSQLCFSSIITPPMAGHVPHWSEPWPTDLIVQVWPWTCLLTMDLLCNLDSWLTLATGTNPALLPSFPYCGFTAFAVKASTSCLSHHGSQLPEFFLVCPFCSLTWRS